MPASGELDLGEAIDAFREAWASRCNRASLRKYIWALHCLYRAHATPPRSVADLVEFVRGEPLSSNSKRVLWGALRVFYAWAIRYRDPALPALPHVFFGTRRLGERRGGRRR